MEAPKGEERAPPNYSLNPILHTYREKIKKNKKI